MATVLPFAALHYNSQAVPLSEVIAPPYDVLSSADQDALYQRHPANIVRLILNRETPYDTDTANRYARAAEFLAQAREQNVIVQDDAPAFYEYLQQFPHPLHPEQQVVRTTLFVALQLEPYENGVVLPHEETISKAKTDRLNLMRATHANPEPIYGLYQDLDNSLVKQLRMARKTAPPLLEAEYSGPGAAGTERHLLYAHHSAETVEAVQRFFEQKRIWIADGHHRYETALNYQREQRAARSGAEGALPCDSILIGLSAFEEPGLVVLPTHRMVKNIAPALLEEMEQKLAQWFDVRHVTHEEARAWIAQPSADSRRFAILRSADALALTLKTPALPKEIECGNQREAWRALDVSILQILVLDNTLGIAWQELAHTPNIGYTRDDAAAQAAVQGGEYQLACLLQNPAVTDIREVAADGDKMPQKSTYFYPKLYSGILLRTLQ